jgi:hypothetical protein
LQIRPFLSPAFRANFQWVSGMTSAVITAGVQPCARPNLALFKKPMTNDERPMPNVHPFPSLPALPFRKRFQNSQATASRRLASIDLLHFPPKIRKGKRFPTPARRGDPDPAVSFPVRRGPRLSSSAVPFPRFPHFPEGSAGNQSQPRSCQELMLVRAGHVSLQKSKKGSAAGRTTHHSPLTASNTTPSRTDRNERT